MSDMTLVERVAKEIADQFYCEESASVIASIAITETLEALNEWESDNCTSFHAFTFAKVHNITLKGE